MVPEEIHELRRLLPPVEEPRRIIAAAAENWLKDNREKIKALEKVFSETCVVDQLGIVHDRTTGEIMAPSKLLWFERKLQIENGNPLFL